MSKIYLYLNVEERKQYYIDREVDQFYVARLAPLRGKDWSWYFVGFMIVAGSSIATMHTRIDNFYIPRATVVSNSLLLAILLVAAGMFCFWAKKRARSWFDTKNYQPILLEDERKKYLLEKAKGNAVFTLGFTMIAFCCTIICIVFFMRTSESRLYVLTSIPLFLFAGVVHRAKVQLIERKYIVQHLAQYKK